MSDSIKAPNKGTGAGGANTTKSGGSFEQKTSNRLRLQLAGFVSKKIPKTKYSYLEKRINEEADIVYVTKKELKAFAKHVLNVDMYREPDEAYIFRYRDTYTIKIVEMKNQHVGGSVDTKLMAGPMFIEQYSRWFGPNFKIEYAFCVGDFLRKSLLKQSGNIQFVMDILKTHNIPTFFGDSDEYFTQLDEWLGL